MSERIYRVTMAKIPHQEDQKVLVEMYRDIVNHCSRNGRHVILKAAVGIPEQDALSQGYTLVSQTQFANLDDMQWYSDKCPEHQKLKAYVKNIKCDGVMTVYYKPQVVHDREQL